MNFFSPASAAIVVGVGAATGLGLDFLHRQLLLKLTDGGVFEAPPQNGPAKGRRMLLALACSALFLACFWRFGLSLTFVAWCVFVSGMVALAVMDWETTILPDDLTLPLLWCGLLAATSGLTGIDVRSAVWGAAGGYAALWCIYQAYRLLTGAEGLGFGDFKLFAAIGAWGGLDVLAPAALFASLFATPIGLWMRTIGQLREDKFIPLGPFLAGGGLLVVLVGVSSFSVQ
jgi:leader peptidase (prepilin peptidase)/N-methyltransferase